MFVCIIIFPHTAHVSRLLQALPFTTRLDRVCFVLQFAQFLAIFIFAPHATQSQSSSAGEASPGPRRQLLFFLIFKRRFFNKLISSAQFRPTSRGRGITNQHPNSSQLCPFFAEIRHCKSSYQADFQAIRLSVRKILHNFWPSCTTYSDPYRREELCLPGVWLWG